MPYNSTFMLEDSFPSGQLACIMDKELYIASNTINSTHTGVLIKSYCSLDTIFLLSLYLVDPKEALQRISDCQPLKLFYCIDPPF